MKSKRIVIANWKMNPVTSSEARALFTATLKLASRLKKTEVVVAPSAIHIPLLRSTSKKISLGAQDAYPEEKGAFTGEVSVLQLAKLGVKYVIVGHSERRAMGETDEMVGRKVSAVLKAKMTPILCIGERVHDSQGGYLLFLTSQIKSAFKGISRADASRVIVAYEPIWAIGRHAVDAMKPNDLHETVLYIQKILTEIYGREGAKKVSIIYGAAVEPNNAGSLIEHGAVSGFLVGHASLSAETLGPILKAVDTV